MIRYIRNAIIGFVFIFFIAVVITIVSAAYKQYQVRRADDLGESTFLTSTFGDSPEEVKRNIPESFSLLIDNTDRNDGYDLTHTLAYSQCDLAIWKDAIVLYSFFKGELYRGTILSPRKSTFADQLVVLDELTCIMDAKYGTHEDTLKWKYDTFRDSDMYTALTSGMVAFKRQWDMKPYDLYITIELTDDNAFSLDVIYQDYPVSLEAKKHVDAIEAEAARVKARNSLL